MSGLLSDWHSPFVVHLDAHTRGGAEGGGNGGKNGNHKVQNFLNNFFFHSWVGLRFVFFSPQSTQINTDYFLYCHSESSPPYDGGKGDVDSEGAASALPLSRGARGV